MTATEFPLAIRIAAAARSRQRRMKVARSAPISRRRPWRRSRSARQTGRKNRPELPRRSERAHVTEELHANTAAKPDRDRHPSPAGDQLDQHIGDEAEPDAGRDRIGERHGDGGDHGRRVFGDVVPVDIGKAPPSRRRRTAAPRPRRRPDHPASGEKNSASRNRIATKTAVSPVRPPACDARRAFDIARGGRGADQRAEHGGEAVGDQRLLHARQLAVLVDQSGCVGHADQRAGIVEHVDQQDRESRRSGRSSSKVREKSSCNRVGASDGGIETMPVNFASPSGRPMSVTTRMPISVPPMMRRKLSATIRTKPSRHRIGAGLSDRRA